MTISPKPPLAVPVGSYKIETLVSVVAQPESMIRDRSRRKKV
jgi:hypothetical protein